MLLSVSTGSYLFVKSESVYFASEQYVWLEPCLIEGDTLRLSCLLPSRESIRDASFQISCAAPNKDPPTRSNYYRPDDDQGFVSVDNDKPVITLNYPDLTLDMYHCHVKCILGRDTLLLTVLYVGSKFVPCCATLVSHIDILIYFNTFINYLELKPLFNLALILF